jgi:CRISPR-associated protein Csh1
MSLAHKLYNIGKAITDKETIKSLIIREPDSSTDYQTVAINFNLKKDEVIYDDISNRYCENVFYSDKLGGSGSAIFYLYPNLIIHKSTLVEIDKKKIKGKFSQLIATLENIITYHYANKKNEELLQSILEQISDKKIIDKLKTYPKGDYLYLITINNKSLFEVMPEIWENWFKTPAIPYKDLEPKEFYDFISTEQIEVGYNPDIGCYTVNNYNDKMKHRIIDNIPLSKESARFIKFGWLYVRKYLMFYFDGMSFSIIPSYVKENEKEFRDILSKLKLANEQSQEKRNSLKNIANEESRLKKGLDKLEKRKKKDEKKIAEVKEELEEKQKKKIKFKLADGLITNFKEDIEDLKFYQGLTVDFIFMEFNKNEVKIYGSIEEVLPSRVSKIIEKMKEYNIKDTLLIGNKDHTQTYLHDFFHRNELYFYMMNKRKNDPKDNSYRPKILEERFYLAKLLLTNTQISQTDLYKRFEFNTEFDYEHKKRINDKGTKVWFEKERGLKIYQDEQNILSFFKDKEINKIKD